MTLDWNFIAGNLAAHLSMVDDRPTIERILQQAKGDAILMDAPPDFWSCVAAAYSRQALRPGRTQNAHIIACLRRNNDEAARQPPGRRS
jgi:hypothetical protein